MTDAAPAPAAPAPTPAAPPPPVQDAKANGQPGTNDHEATPPAAPNETPPPFDPSSAGLVWDAEAKAYGRKVKVGGKEVFFRVDDEQTWTRAGLGTAAHQRMDEAAREKQQVQAMLAALERDLTQKDPRARARAVQNLLSGLEVDVAETVNAWIQDVQEHQKLTPEQRRIRELEEAVASREAEQRRLAAEAQARAAQAQKREDLRQLRTGITQALPSAGIDPSDVHAQMLMIQRMEAVIQATDKMPDLAEVAQWVRKTMRGSVPRVLAGASDDEILDLLGEDQIKRVLARQMARQKDPARKPAPIVQADRAPRAAQDAEQHQEPTTPAQQIAALRKSGAWRGRT